MVEGGLVITRPQGPWQIGIQLQVLGRHEIPVNGTALVDTGRQPTGSDTASITAHAGPQVGVLVTLVGDAEQALHSIVLAARQPMGRSLVAGPSALVKTVACPVHVPILQHKKFDTSAPFAVLAGGGFYLTKPTRPLELVAVVNNLFARLEVAKRPLPWQLTKLLLHAPSGSQVELSGSEAQLLKALAVNGQFLDQAAWLAHFGDRTPSEKTKKARREVPTDCDPPPFAGRRQASCLSARRASQSPSICTICTSTTKATTVATITSVW